jgi:N-acetylglutamate synthase-like GNAT family acetyltransferase
MTIEEIINRKIGELHKNVENYTLWEINTDVEATAKLLQKHRQMELSSIWVLENIRDKISSLTEEEFWFMINTFHTEFTG